jgi:outer membrane autotransporter protein
MIKLRIKYLPFCIASLFVSANSFADCLPTGPTTFNCAGISDNAAPLNGNGTLDNAAGDVTLNNDSTGIITNDRSADNGGPMNTLETNGTGNVLINNEGTVQGGRGDVFDINGNQTATAYPYDPSLLSDNGAGGLLYDGSPAGVASTIHLGAGASSVVINNLYGTPASPALPADYYGMLLSGGEFSAVIFGNATDITINNQAGIFNNSFSGTVGDTRSEGHWAIANYGTGTTVLNLGGGFGTVIGDILFVDRNPLLEAAQQLNPALVLEYDASNVGIRNSVINIGVNGSVNQNLIQGNIYLGAGTHEINTAISGTIAGNIYVDQRDAVISDAAGNPISTIAGNKQFTFNSNGIFDNQIVVNDVVGSVNTLNFNLGGADGQNTASLSTPGSIVFNGLGQNTLNANCIATIASPSASCSLGSSATGLTTVYLSGDRFVTSTSATLQANQDINIDAREFYFSDTQLIAPTVTIGAGATVGATQLLAPDTDVLLDVLGSITGNLVNRGNLIVRDATMNIDGDVFFDANSNLTLRMRSFGNGQLNITGTGVFSNNASITPIIKDLYIRNGDTFTVSNNTTGSPIINDGTGIVQFSSDDSTGDLRLIATVAIPTGLNATQGAINATNTVMNYAGNNAGLNALALEIQSLDGVELKRTAERLRPESHDGAIRLVLSNVDHIFGLVEHRLYENQLSGTKRFATENPEKQQSIGAGLWTQGFGSDGTQDFRKNTDGYRLKSSGFAAGVDRLLGVDQDIRLGVLAAYSRGNVDNSGFTDNHNLNINTYTGGVYGAKSFNDWYLNGAMALSLNRYDSRRVVLGQVADGSHDSWQFTTKVDAGWPIQLNDNFTLVPIASLNYNRINEQGYTEKGSRPVPIDDDVNANGLLTIPRIDNAARLKISSREFDSIRAGIGAKTLFNIQEMDWNAGIELHALLSHEFGDLAQDATARFVAGGDRFFSPGAKLARNTILMGGNIRLTGNDENDQVTLLIGYDAEAREKYIGQSLSMMLRYDFDQAANYVRRANLRKEAKSKQLVAAQSVEATEQDIDAIVQAMKPTQNMSSAALTAEQTQILTISNLLNIWVNALVNKNAEGYFNTYASDFIAPEGATRQQWERKRKLEIAQSDSPSIKIVNLSIKPNGTQASAYFTLLVQQGRNEESVLKSVDLIQKNGRWFIVSEDSLQILAQN